MESFQNVTHEKKKIREMIVGIFREKHVWHKRYTPTKEVHGFFKDMLKQTTKLVLVLLNLVVEILEIKEQKWK